MARGVLLPGSKVAVIGATGGVGQLTVASLLRQGYEVRAVSRKGGRTYGSEAWDGWTAWEADTRSMEGARNACEGMDAVICCTGTTAFPTLRWKEGGTPKEVDALGVTHLVQAATEMDVQRFVLVSSAGVDRKESLPFSIMNLFGVLDSKKIGEDVLKRSGIPYTILRPSRLTDGPYTSYDLNTLIQGISGTRQKLVVSPSDELVGECGRIILSEAIAQMLVMPCTVDRTYHLESVEGSGPSDANEWEQLFV